MSQALAAVHQKEAQEPQGFWRKLAAKLREGLVRAYCRFRPKARVCEECEPGYWKQLANILREGASDALNAAERQWLWLLAVATLIAFALLDHWSGRLVGAETATDKKCFEAALAVDGASAVKSCEAQLRRVVAAVAPGGARTCTPEGLNRNVLCAFDEPAWPRLFVWADNVLVALYTGFFGGCIGRAYARLRAQRRFAPIALELALGVSVLSCLVGAVIDLSENFWLLAHFGHKLAEPSPDVSAVAELSVWKFRLAALNLALAIGWSVWAAWRRHVPYPVLFRWPRRWWDRRSRRWFDPRTVDFDIANAARAYPLFPADLIAMCGAPGGAQVRCEVDGNRLVVRAESPMLKDPYVVVAELEANRRTLRTVHLQCPNLNPTLRDQGLDELMVLACCCSAWRMGALSVESVVAASTDARERAQNRRWVRLALRLGWDAEISKGAREDTDLPLPAGLAHVRSMQELTRYPDGRRWWSLKNFELTLRFVCDPEGLQLAMDPARKHFDLERLSVDRLCIARLQAFASERGVRLGL